MMIPAQIFCIGVNHETAPLNVREDLASLPGQIDPLLQNRYPQIDEWVWLSTCNRVELYTACVCEESLDAVQHLFSDLYGEHETHIEPYFYTLRNEEAAGHLLRVASGLDSMVLGEPQILGQVNRAFSDAQERGTVGPVLTTLFRAALTGGKRVRNETAIGKNPASVPSVAINQARARMGGLNDREILLVGAGAMAQTAIKALRARDYTRISVANRTADRARTLAEPWHGKSFGLDQLPEALATADIVFCAIRVDEPLLTAALLANVQEMRQGSPLLLFDLGVPRNVEPAAGGVPGVNLIDIDRLRAELDESLIARRAEVPVAETILEEEAIRLQANLAEVSMRPVITGLRQKAEAIRRRELERTLRHLGELDSETIKHIDHLSHALVNQLLHEPTLRLRREANGDRPDAMSQVVRELFDL